MLLTKARSEAGLSRAAVARRLRKPVAWVASVEAGRSSISIRDFIRIARLYGLDAVKESRKLMLASLAKIRARRARGAQNKRRGNGRT